MRILSAELLNWMPFVGRHVLQLPAGPVAVVARHLANPRRSNWAGKTAFIDAIRWCLFGTHRKRLDDDVISRGCDRCEVILDLGDVLVSRSRTRGKSTVLTMTVGGESARGPAAQQALIERLCMSLDDYEATIDFRQDDIESIVGMRTGKRREVIAAWLRLEKWTAAARQAADRMRTAMQGLVEVRAALKATDEVLSDEEEQALLEKAERQVADIASMRWELSGIDEAISAIGDPDTSMRQLAELDRLRKLVGELRPRLKERAAIVAQRATASAELAAATLAATQAQQRLRDLVEIKGKGFDGMCPVMCSSCPAADVVTAEVMRKAEMFEGASRAHSDVREARNVAREKVEALDAELRELDRIAGQHASAVERGKELAAGVGNLTADGVEAQRGELAALRSRRKVAVAAVENAVEEAARDAERIASSQRSKQRRAERERELAGAERAVRIAALMVKALGPTGVPARIARAHVQRLEQAANELLRDCGLSIEFAWERATKDLVPTCSECGHVYTGQRDKACPRCSADRGAKMSEELEILVDDGSGEIEDVKAKSGGARVLVASSLRLSASAMLRDVRGTPVAWATIDEPFGPLDEENREALARVFSGMLGSVGLEQAFVVSHDVALLDSLPHRIIVERDGSTSTLRLEAA
jgi:DNA repair exonuclease SbcCD ATPase subunit